MNIREVFYALSDDIRLKIVRILIENEEVCVCQFQEIFGLSQPNVSFHLRILKKAGLVKSRKEGKWSYYSLNRENPVLDALIPFLLSEIPPENIKLSCERR
ncbi:metalloregulator ArsR/SmtB family transcription factor [Persephonella sp.]|uniref:ArsR/SmtB family transcription factor n=1 Tax=Persephonella sp. TaxID=2060922 RepID=UPI0025F74A2E|nr:metalloregulator ArsR/SmtB family transcription factor [Persephonella sp.]